MLSLLHGRSARKVKPPEHWERWSDGLFLDQMMLAYLTAPSIRDGRIHIRLRNENDRCLAETLNGSGADAADARKGFDRIEWTFVCAIFDNTSGQLRADPRQHRQFRGPDAIQFDTHVRPIRS